MQESEKREMGQNVVDKELGQNRGDGQQERKHERNVTEYKSR